MKYYCPTSSSMVDKPLSWGVITEYRRWGVKPIQEGRRWIADNGCFSDNWDRAKWMTWIFAMQEYVDICDFAVLPDVVGDHKETLYRYAQFYNPVKKLGYKCAFVCQDGCVPKEIPPCDAIFIGGSTVWKMSPEARECIKEGQKRGVQVHIGRVNSAKRYAYFLLQGADSFDGTSYCFAPDIVTKQIEKLAGLKPLFIMDGVKGGHIER